MITLTRLNNESFTINALYIEQIEALPDTTISLVSKRKVFVKESLEEVKESVTAFYKEIGLNGLIKEIGDHDES
ncbi:flagellar FlbD family protein [Saliterribacillus persicus]|uniref:Flagellar protein FlbD n=1 Tax=Saliterribacillus persicus TaxID=930114 RepID=A0A368XRM8_9BACI|nr:flagellar FlbD family protein [Saliterribacillus persicus]RCW70710.1 flagellar protein FlbD [Saliterribacillus persicus]